MGPQGSGGSQHGFTALKCALALHILAVLHGLLMHCALAELQNSRHGSSQHGADAAVGASDEAYQDWHDFLCVLTAIQTLSLHHLTAISWF